MKNNVILCGFVVFLLEGFAFVSASAWEVPQPPAQKGFREVSADEVAEAFERLAPHPRLLLTDEALAETREKIKIDPLWAKYAETLKKSGDALDKEKPLERIQTGRRLLSVSREALRRIFTLSFLYRLEGETKYAERARTELLAVCAFSDWNPSHFLDVAEMSAAVAIGYDACFDALSPEDRDLIAAALLKLGIEPSLGKKPHWLQNPANWNQVCHCGMAFGALALAEREPELARAIVLRSVNGVTWSMASYEPDGNYTEGASYWGYGTSFNILFIAALDSALSTDFGRSDASGFLKSINYYEHVFGVGGDAYNYSDCGDGPADEPTAFYFAKKLGDPTTTYNENRMLAAASAPNRPRGGISLESTTRHRLAPTALLWGPARPAADLTEALKREIAPLPENGFVGIGNTLCPVFLVRRADAYLGFKAGTPRAPHGHMDVGSFVYEKDGIRWFVELGPEPYHRIESLGLNLWGMNQESDRWTLFRYSPFGHSTLTVNGELPRVAGKGIFTETDLGAPDRPASATADLTSLYEGQLASAIRSVALELDGTLAVVDRLAAPAEAKALVETRFITRASVEILSDDSVRLSAPNPSQPEGEPIVKTLCVASDIPVALRVAPAETDLPRDSKNPGALAIILTEELPPGAQATLTVSVK